MDESIRLLDTKRRNILNQNRFINASVIIYFVLGIILLFLMSVRSSFAHPDFFVILTILVIVIAASAYVSIVIRRRIRVFEAELRDKIVGPYLYERYGGPEYISQNKFSKEEIANFCIIPNTHLVRPYIFNSEDYIRGTYKGVAYEQASAQMVLYTKRHVYQAGLKNRLKPKYDFDGRILLFSSPRFQNINSVKITTKSFPYSGSGLLNEKVLTGNELFDQCFIVSAINSQDVYNLLTPQFMAEILNLKNYFNGFSLYIYRGMVYIAINKLSSPFNKVYGTTFDRNQVNQMTDEYMNVTSRMLDTIFAVFL